MNGVVAIKIHFFSYEYLFDQALFIEKTVPMHRFLNVSIKSGMLLARASHLALPSSKRSGKCHPFLTLAGEGNWKYCERSITHPRM